MPLKKVFWLCVIAIINHAAYSQNLNFNYYKVGTEEGMNSLNVFNLEQDSTGLMHVTTDNGVYLYNGYGFSLIKNDLVNPTIISSFIKNNSSIYLSTQEKGIVELNYKNRQQKELTATKLSASYDKIIVTNDHIYLLLTSIRLDILDLKTNTLIKDVIKEKDKNNQAHCLFKTKDGKVLVGRSDGLYEMNGTVAKKLDLIKNLPAYALTENNKGELLIGSVSKIFFAKENKLLREIVPTYKTNTFSFGGEKSINKIICDNYGRIWFSSSPNENVYVYYNGKTHDIFNELNITPILINCIYKDRDENIWIGTMDDGIYVIQNSFFNNISVNPDNKPLSVNKILFKDDLILTATSNGFYAFNFVLNEMKTISAPDNIILEPIYDVKEMGGVINYTKRSQFDLSASIIVSGNRSYKFNPILGKLVHKLPNGQLVLCDWMANVLLTNSNGTKTIDTLISFPDFSQNVAAIYSHNDTLLIGTNKGLYYSNFKPNIYSSTGKNPTKKVNDISLINGQLIICHDDGIEFLNTGEEIKMLGSKPLNGVKKIRENNDLIWIVTKDGLFICDKNLHPIKIYNRANGISASSINDISFNDRYTCISTSKGISIGLTTDIIQRGNVLNPVSIDMIKINDRSAYYDQRSIALNADDNDVTILFNSPYFNELRSTKQRFRYKLDNGNWAPIDNLALNVPAMNGGVHKVQIQATTDDINWSNSTTIEFRKEEKFSESRYSTFIIILLASVIASLISYFIIKRIKKRALKRIADEQQVNMLKHQAMNSLLSPHFIFNSLTSIQNYINSNNSLKASEYLAKFSRLIRMIIERAAQSEIVLKDEVTRLSYYLELEKERFKNKFDYTITVDEKLDVNTVTIPNMIIQPHAENCIIHGILPKMTHGKLDITFKRTDAGKLLITIEDDGIGLIEAKKHSKTGHKSLGTATIKNILELNSKLTGKKQKVDMVDKSTLGNGQNGTIITLELEL